MINLVRHARDSLTAAGLLAERSESSGGKSTVARLLAGFFILMLALTVLSRAADALTVAKVDVSAPRSGTLSYDIEAEGMIEAVKERSVTAKAGLRVLDVLVEEGQHVNKGDPLVAFDPDDVKEQLDQAEGELQKLILQKKQQKLGGVAAENAVVTALTSLQNAKEDYAEALQTSSQDIVRAQQDLAQANEDYRVAQQNATQAQCSSRQQAIDSAQKEYDGVAYSRGEALRTAQRAAEDAQSALSAAQATGDAAAVAAAQTALDRSLEDQKSTVAHWDQSLANAQGALDAAKGGTGSAAQPAESARKAVEAAERALQDAADNQAKQLRAAQRAVDSAQQQLESTQKEKSNGAQQTLYQVQSLDIDIRAKQCVVDALTDIANDNVLLTPENGIVQTVSTKVGQRTNGEELLHLTCEDQGAKFSAELDEEQAKHISLGDPVSLTLDGDTSVIQTSIVSISPEDGKKAVRITAALPTDAPAKARPGKRATIRIQKRSKTYSACLPVSAIRQDNGGKYVLVMREQDSVLGKQAVAARINVTVADTDGTSASISGGIGVQERVISGSSKPIDSGDRVRLRES